MSALAVARSSFATSLVRYRRSWGLWLLLLIAPVSARYWIAGKDEAFAAIVIGGKAPVMTSAILGVSLGVILSTVLLPVAFIYLRSNTTRRQPWQIEETTAASRLAISFGRFGADIAVFGAMLVAMNLAGWLLAWVVGPADGVRLLDISLGLWPIAAPALIGVAALRIAFDSLPITRAAAGEVVFFFLLLVSLMASVSSARNNRGFASAMMDFAGYTRPVAHTLTLEKGANITVGKVPAISGRSVAIDAKRGLLSDGYIASRLAWVGCAVMLVALAGIVYRPHRPGRRWSLRGWIAGMIATRPPPPAQADTPPAFPSRAPLIGVFTAEFRLIALGRGWLAVALASSVAALGWISDFRGVACPAILLLLIFGLSAHAGRSEQSGLLALTRTTVISPNVRRVVFIVAGIAWSLLLALPAIVKAALANSFEPLAIALAAGTIVAIVAITLGTWSRSAVASRLLLLIAWYGWMTAP